MSEVKSNSFIDFINGAGPFTNNVLQRTESTISFMKLI